MFAERWIYDFTIYVYALSLLFACSDLLQASKRSQRISYGLLVLVWLLQTMEFTFRVFEFFPMATRFDSLFIYSWMLVSFTLILNRYSRLMIFSFIANLFSFTVLAIHFFFARDVSPVLEQLLLSELVFIHMTMAIMAYAALTLASICAGLYLITTSLLKKRKWNHLLRRLPSLDRLQWILKWLVMSGILLLLIALILGVIYAYQTVGQHFWIDIKILGSLMVLFVYGFVLYRSIMNKWYGRRLAWWTTLSIFVIICNYLLSKSSMSFHHWI